MNIKAVIFDLGRVLIQVDFRRGLFPYLEGQQAKDDKTIVREVYKNPLFINYCTGKIDSRFLHSEIKRLYGLKLSYQKFMKVWCDVFAPMPGIEELVNKVSARCKIGLLSDTDPMHWAYVLKNYPFLQNFSKPTLSFEIGYLKPDPICYQKAAENVAKNIKSCLFIDDRSINVEGAKKSGMESIQFQTTEQLDNDLKAAGLIS